MLMRNHKEKRENTIKSMLDEEKCVENLSDLKELNSNHKVDETSQPSRKLLERKIRFSEEMREESLENIELYPTIRIKQGTAQEVEGNESLIDQKSQNCLEEETISRRREDAIKQQNPSTSRSEQANNLHNANHEKFSTLKEMPNDLARIINKFSAQSNAEQTINTNAANLAKPSNSIMGVPKKTAMLKSTRSIAKACKVVDEELGQVKKTQSKATAKKKSYQTEQDEAAFELRQESNVNQTEQRQEAEPSLKNLDSSTKRVSMRQSLLNKIMPKMSSSSISIARTFCQAFYDEHKHKNALIVFGIKSLKLEKHFANLEDMPKTICIIFMNFESVVTDFIFESTNEVNFTKIYEVNISTTLLENLANKSVLFELHLIVNDGQKLIATGELHTKSLLYYPQKKLTTILDLLAINQTRRTINSRLGQLTIKMQLVLNLKHSKEYKDDIFNSKTNLLDINDDERKEREDDFIEVPLASCMNSRDSLFNVDIHDSSSSEDFGKISKKSSIKVPDWKRSLEEYAILKGYSSTLIKLNKWKEEHLLNIPIRSYELVNAYYKTEVILSILKLIILKDSFIMSNDKIKYLFLDYSFLTHTGTQMESALRCKSNLTNEIVFNHVKVFSINPNEDIEDCKLLVKAIRKNKSIEIKLICEPIEDTTFVQTCYKIGIGVINIFELIQEEENELDLKVPILTEDEKIYLGYFAINISGIQAMREVSLYTINKSLDKNDVALKKNFEENDDALLDRYEILNRFIKTDESDREECDVNEVRATT